MKNELNDNDLKQVSGGYRVGFNDSQVCLGMCFKVTTVPIKENTEIYVLIVGNNCGPGMFDCRKWVVENGVVIVNGIETYTQFNDANMIYTPVDNPPEFVHV